MKRKKQEHIARQSGTASIYKIQLQRSHFISASFVLCLLAGLTVFWAGISGPFLFDDIPNLRPLGDRGGVTSLDTLLSFILGGSAGALGRPLSLLSFVMNDQYWPAVPWSFKYTNLLIHLLNGVLVFALILQLGRLVAKDPLRTQLLALTTMALWLLHPMQLSTVMLVVQRMTELSATFTLAGLIFYLHGRRLVTTATMRGYTWMSAGIVAGTLLAVLSKENGILLPLYALVLEVTLVRAASLEGSSYWKVWCATFLALPLLALALYFAFRWPSILQGFKSRQFTQVERLLTEFRILIEYLAHIFVPRLAGSGLFHDNYPISISLFSPLSTFVSVSLLGGLAALAALARKTHPVLSFGILWFFAGHALESGFLPLELYFEHRNYLPMLGPLFALAYYLSTITGGLKTPAFVAVAIYIGLEIVLSAQSSAVWGNYALAANVWANENPGSVRAQQAAADYWSTKGNYNLALKHLLIAEDFNPRNLGVRIEAIQMQCLEGQLDPVRLRNTIRRIPNGEYDNAGLEGIRKLHAIVDQGLCHGLRYSDLHDLLNAYLRNPYYAEGSARGGIYYEKGLLYAAAKELSPAVESLDKAYKSDPSVDIALLQASWLLSARLYDAALHYVDVARRTKSNVPFVSREEDIQNLEKLIHKQMGTATIHKKK